jgi:hypothetical protein
MSLLKNHLRFTDVQISDLIEKADIQSNGLAVGLVQSLCSLIPAKLTKRVGFHGIMGIVHWLTDR